MLMSCIYVSTSSYTLNVPQRSPGFCLDKEISSQVDAFSGKSIHILHLEDSVDDADIIADALDRAGLACQIARVESRKSFTEAIEHKQEASWDIILADYSLPSFDGISALEIAREKCPEVPFIIVSGALGEEVAVEVLKAGATD